MPHCQKENHDRSSKSKKERQRLKSEKAASKKAAADAAALEAAELAASALLSNNLALAEGHGAYEVGCEPTKEIRGFNAKKRSKKHLRNDLRRKEEREEREEEERRKKEAEEEHRRRQKEREEQDAANARAGRGEAEEKDDDDEAEEEEEEPPLIEEYIVYVCECCEKRFKSRNHFVDHANSRRHRAFAAIYEEAGMLVTGVEIRTGERDADGEGGDEEGECYDDDVDDDADADVDAERDVGATETETVREHEGEDDGEGEEGAVDDDDDDSELDEPDHQKSARSRTNLFAAFGAFDDDDSSSSSSESSEDDNDEERPPPAPAQRELVDEDSEDDDDDDFDLLDEIIDQNRILRNKLDAEESAAGAAVVSPKPAPLPFDDERYDPKDYDVNENRLAAVHHRLQKRLAERGIEPTNVEAYACDAIAVGKSLLQLVMEAKIDTLQSRVEAYERHKAECDLLGRAFASSNGTSKALAGQYVRKRDAADDTRKRANVHHAGSHYHMQAARSMQYGRTKGLMARHSSQGSRLQASRMAAAQETARMQTGGGGAKGGKVSSKKSNVKRSGNAGGSKKCGGEGGGGGGEN